jgi:hypothetical protein
MLWYILVQFVFRLAFGLAATMAWVSPRRVTAGFYRVHLWVGLGLNTFVAGILYLLPDFEQRRGLLLLAIAAGVLSYVGAVIWLYERAAVGQWALVVVALTNYAGAVLAGMSWEGGGTSGTMAAIDALTSGMLLGSTLTAMFLGHWYLNTPSMQLLPLQRLVLLIGVTVLIRAVVAGTGLAIALSPQATFDSTRYALLALRWFAGIAGVLALAAMTWQTLKIPNTQSATGILYVAVIFAFLGELTSQLLSVHVPVLV